VLRLPWQADRGQLRLFALILGLLLVALARGWRHASGIGSAALGALGLALLVLAIVAPFRVRGLYLLWLTATAPIAWIVSYVLLGVLYFIVITPIGLTLRVLGKNALLLRRPPSRRTLWHPRPRPQGFESYRRQT
jgi:hypothetical protein